MKYLIYYYLIDSSKEFLKIIDFFNNNRKMLRITGYNLVKNALKLKNNTFFGEKDSQNIIIRFSIRSDDFLNDILSGRSSINPKYLVSKGDVDNDEFNDKYGRNTFKKGISFEKRIEFYEYLERNAFKFNNNSLLPSLSLLDYWYIPISSNKIHQDLINYYCKTPDIQDKYYIIIDEEIKCKDNRILGIRDKITLCIGFITFLKKPFELMVNEGIIERDDIFRATVFKEEYLSLDYYYWNFKHKKKSFNKQTDLVKHLEKLNLKFDDESTFIPIKDERRS